jgi:aerobic carbon-monoxide dehydrogenase medium subunit
MIDNSVAYRRPSTVDGAVLLLARHGADAMVLAGGQSLIPAMKAGHSRPGVLVDVGRLAELTRVQEGPGHLAVGASVRHHDLHHSLPVRRHAPLLAHVAGQVADPQIRHRGTIGGSLAYADPAADLPVALLALAATVVLRGPDGRRELPIGDFCLGRHRTALRPGELVTEVLVPYSGAAAWSYQKFSRDALQWAIVAVAAVRHATDGDGAAVSGPRVSVAIGNVADRPVPAAAVTAAVARGLPAEEAARFADEGADPPPDQRASAEYRRHLARVLTARALRELDL